MNFTSELQYFSINEWSCLITDGFPPSFAFLPHCDDWLTLFIDDKLIVNSLGYGQDRVFFVSCNVSVISVLCYNNAVWGAFGAKSYNSLSDQYVSDDTWLVYSSPQPLTDKWYESTYNDSSWKTVSLDYPYTTLYVDWRYFCLPETLINDTYWFMTQKPFNIQWGNNEYTNVYYRFKVEGENVESKHTLCRASSVVQIIV